MTAEQLARKMRRRAALVEPEFRKTTRRLAIDALRFARERMTAGIYAKPVPRRPKSGKPMWRRTGNLRRSERWEQQDAYTVRIVNDANYAEPRHEAGKPGRRPTRYPAHWRDELVEKFRDIVTQAYRDTILAILRRGGG